MKEPHQQLKRESVRVVDSDSSTMSEKHFFHASIELAQLLIGAADWLV
jgi:hypothetical protein